VAKLRTIPAFGWILDASGLLDGPPFESGEPLVAGGQDAARDQDFAQVVDGAAGQVLVEVGVARWRGGPADLGKDRPGCAPGQPLKD
jgi:hypothetical protein